MKQRINPEQFGGAPLLGLTKNVIKAHGSSNRNHVSGAINSFGHCPTRYDYTSLDDIHEANEILRPESILKRD